MTGRIPVAVEIVKAPLGEAPLWVREAWVGLTLPLVPGRASRANWSGTGVLTGATTVLGAILERVMGKTQIIDGYLVQSGAALDVLARHAPNALAWWLAETHYGKMPDRGFIFDAPACRPIYAD